MRRAGPHRTRPGPAFSIPSTPVVPPSLGDTGMTATPEARASPPQRLVSGLRAVPGGMPALPGAGRPAPGAVAGSGLDRSGFGAALAAGAPPRFAKRAGQSADSMSERLISMPKPGASFGTSLPRSGRAIPGTLR